MPLIVNKISAPKLLKKRGFSVVFAYFSKFLKKYLKFTKLCGIVFKAKIRTRNDFTGGATQQAFGSCKI
jgi:hypothetical protein